VVAHPTLHGILTQNLGGNHHPLTMATLALNYAMSGLNASSYHWLNLLLHLVDTALVFFFVRKLSGGRLWTSVVTALFFGIHPMHVESVAWISERKDVLYALFYLVALLTYLRYLEGGWVWLAATWIAFVLSAASKPAAVVLPVTLLLIDWFRKRPLRGKTLVEKVPFFLVSAAVGALTFTAQKQVGAVHTELWGPLQKIIFASVGTVMYVVKLFVPVQLSGIYPLPATSTVRYPTLYYLAPFLVLAGLAATVLVGRKLRPILFGVAFFFINIALVLQIVSVGAALMADRYTYVPYIGLFLAMAWWLDEPAGSPRARWRPVLMGVFGILFVFSIVQTWNRSRVYHDPEIYWNDVIAKYPGKVPDAYYNRGNYYMKEGRNQEALADFNRSVDLNAAVPRVWYNKGMMHAQMNQPDSALAAFDRALALDPKNPDALNNRGAMRYRRGDIAGAIADWSRILDANPRYRDGYLNRAVAYMDLKQFDKSVEDRRRGIELDPSNPANVDEYALMARALQSLGRHREAVDALDHAIAAAPGNDARVADFYVRRSGSWAAMGDKARALADVREAERRGAKVDPRYVRSLGG